MSSLTEPVAHALAYRWGELKEEPPAFIDELMIDLTEALAEAERAGDEARARCLDEVLDALAQGIAKHERRGSQDFNEETLDRAIDEIRAYYYKESSVPGGEPPHSDASSRPSLSSPSRRHPEDEGP